jgi:hypothetical protein
MMPHQVALLAGVICTVSALFFVDVGYLELISASGWRSWLGCLVASVLIESADQAMSVILWWYPHRVEGGTVWPGVCSRRSCRRTRLSDGSSSTVPAI